MSVPRWFLCCWLLLAGFSLGAQDVVVVTDATLTGNYRMSADRTYLLDGAVIVEAGDTLTIEAGTLIGGRSAATDGGFPSSLVIAAGATIVANGTRDNPIVMTSERAALGLTGELTEEDSWWGGLYILGNAPLDNGDAEFAEYPGAVNLDPRARFGGDDPADVSSELSYLSVRYVQGSGLNFLGVGRRDFFGRHHSFLEAFHTSRNGFYFRGTSTFFDHLVGYANGRSAFFLDDGTQLSGQSWLGVRPPREGGQYGASLLLVSGLPDDDDGNPRTNVFLRNVTLVDRAYPTPAIQAGANGQLVSVRLTAAGTVSQSLFVNGHIPTITLDSLDAETGSYLNYQNGSLRFETNVFANEFRRPEPGTILRLSARPDETLDEEQLSILEQDRNQFRFGPALESSDVTDLRNFSPVLPERSPYLNFAPGFSGSSFVPHSYAGAFGTENWLRGWTAVNRSADEGQTVSGVVLYDPAAFGCEDEDLTTPIPGTFVRINVDGTDYYTTTSDSGRFFLRLPDGETTVEALPPSRVWEQCNDDISYLAEPGRDSFLFISLNDEGRCALPRVSLGGLSLTGTGVSSYEVSYGNLGTVAAERTEILVRLDSNLVYRGSTIPGLTLPDDNHTIRFRLGRVFPLARRSFRIFVEPQAGTPPGREICSTVTIESSSGCPPENSARLEVTGECQEDGETILFEVANVGPLATASPVPFIVVEDEVILNENTLELQPAEVRQFTIDQASDGTFHFSTLATPDSAATAFVAATVSCSADPVIPRAAYPATDLNSNVSTDCRELGAVLTLVDKAATPRGLTTERIVPQQSTLTYRVAFTNVRSDTATVVNVLDTLSPLFDPTTVRLDVASHDYNWEVRNEVLRVTFPDVGLPTDSAAFFTFSVRLRDSVAEGSLVYNDAAVSFDGHPAEVSNRTFHTVGTLYDFLLPTEAFFSVSLPQLFVYPSPATALAQVEVPMSLPRRGSYLVYDSMGRLTGRGAYEHSNFTIDVSGFTPGVFFCTTLSPSGRPTGWQRFMVQ